MITLTKEWLMKTIAELEEERDATPGAANEDAANALAAMKLALASLEAESVAFRSKLKPPSSIGSEHWDYTDHRQPDAFELESCVIERLYTAPPAPVSVPEPIKRNDADGWWMYKGRRVGGGCAEWYNLALDDCRAAMLQGADGKPELTVWYGAMPETNGKTNWTAMLHRKGHHPWEGITIDRSEYPGRVRYEADRMRHLIGELADEPDILAYDSDAHSGYVEPVTTAYKLPFDQWLSQQTGTIDVECGCVMTEVFFHWLRVAYEAGNSPVIPDGWVMVPKRLSAENGAKGTLSGDFSETKFINCPECFGDDDCETCDGSGRIEISVPVSWTTIKAIWAKGVEHFSEAPQQEGKL